MMIQIITRKCGVLRPMELKEMNACLYQLVKVPAHEIQTGILAGVVMI
jgi:hypothetical protein